MRVAGLREQRRALVVAAGVALVLLALGFGAVRALRANAPPAAPAAPALVGTDLRGVPAPDFTLRDQSGASVSLSQLRGHPVVLTFLDSYCTTQCPLMTQYLDQTAQLLGTPTSQVVWLAVSVDPWGDTQASAQAFLAHNKVAIPLRFLLGNEAELRAVWKAYHIGVVRTAGDITHTDGLYVLDAQGRERVWMDAGFDPLTLSRDLAILLGTTPPVRN